MALHWASVPEMTPERLLAPDEPRETAGGSELHREQNAGGAAFHAQAVREDPILDVPPRIKAAVYLERVRLQTMETGTDVGQPAGEAAEACPARFCEP
jgi:hypothetical protein